jgi:hypothetical protein
MSISLNQFCFIYTCLENRKLAYDGNFGYNCDLPGPRSAVRKVRREVRDLRLVCAALHPRQNLRRVQLRILSG